MSPFSSRKQAAWMFAKHPQMAKRWAKHTPDISGLPDYKTEAKKRALKRIARV